MTSNEENKKTEIDTLHKISLLLLYCRICFIAYMNRAHRTFNYKAFTVYLLPKS